MIAFKSIKPGTKFKSSVFRQRTQAAAEHMAPKIQDDFEKTTATWKNKPKFKTEVRVGRAAGGDLAKKVIGTATGVSLEVSTDDPIYGFVDEGTKPHPIVAKKAARLFYRKGSKPKTLPRVIGSGAGAPGTTVGRPQAVQHPGTKAREFSVVIQKKWQPLFYRAMQAALEQAAGESGHGIKG